MNSDKFLNEAEKAALRGFVENELQFNAVKKVLLSPLYEQGTLKQGVAVDQPLYNWAVGVTLNQRTDIYGKPKDDPSDYEKIGQRIFAIVEGLNFIEGGFKELEKYKKIEEKETKNVNEAR